MSQVGGATLESLCPRRIGNMTGRVAPRPDVDTGRANIQIIGKDGTPLYGPRVSLGLPDNLSPSLKLGLLSPSTNTTVEAELWSILMRNREAIPGVGIHTVPVITPSPSMATREETLQYGKDFKDNALAAAKVAMHAEPHYMILGFSLEMVYGDLETNTEIPRELERNPDVLRRTAVLAEALPAALNCLGVKKVAVLTPFNETGNANEQLFMKELGVEVLNIVGFACKTTIDVAHVSDELMEKVIREQLATTPEVEAIVQCGSGLSMAHIADRLEPELGIPIIGINSLLLWYALRDNFITVPIEGMGRLGKCCPGVSAEQGGL